MAIGSSQCADLHDLLRHRPRHRFPPPFVELPLNGVYFIFERGQSTHGGLNRIVRVGSHRGWNNLGPRLWQHITPHGRSSFRWDVGAAILEAELPGFERIPDDVWAHCDAVARSPPQQHEWVERLDLFQTQLSRYMGNTFSFRTVSTADPKEGLELERACIGIVAACEECRTAARPHLRLRNGGHLWNSHHVGRGALQMTDKQWKLIRNAHGDANQ